MFSLESASTTEIEAGQLSRLGLFLSTRRGVPLGRVQSIIVRDVTYQRIFCLVDSINDDSKIDHIAPYSGSDAFSTAQSVYCRSTYLLD
jgi:hypothetical protein